MYREWSGHAFNGRPEFFESNNVLSGIAAYRMLAARDDPEIFSRAKAVGVMALALGVLLWLAGFEVIGGEYFLMWQSDTWNGQESAFRFAVLCMLGLLFLAQHE